MLSQGFQDNPMVLVYLTGSGVLVSATLFATVRLWIGFDSGGWGRRLRKCSNSATNGEVVLKDINGNLSER